MLRAMSSRTAWQGMRSLLSVSLGPSPAYPLPAALLSQRLPAASAARNVSHSLDRRWSSTQNSAGLADPELAARGNDRREGDTRPSQVDTALEISEKKLMSSDERRKLVLSPPALVVTREYEWGNILLGFEQANKYTIRSAPGGEIVGYIAEEDGLGRSITRNLLRTHRSFKATILDSAGEPVLVIRRPFYFISSSMTVEGQDDEVLGEIHMDWHLYRRRYNLYSDNKQFARVDTGFLGVDFDMRDEENRKMASVNKDFTGFAREIFTDARQYVIRMQPDYAGEDISPDGMVREDVKPDPNDIYSKEKITLNQRATVLACAVLIDFDYFSLHSRGGGFGLPFFAPIPMPGGSADDAAPPEGVGTDGAGAGVAGAGAGQDPVVGSQHVDPIPGSQPGPTPSGGESQWGRFEEAPQDFHEPEFPEHESSFGNDSGGDEDGGFDVGSLFDSFFGDDN